MGWIGILIGLMITAAGFALERKFHAEANAPVSACHASREAVF